MAFVLYFQYFFLVQNLHLVYFSQPSWDGCFFFPKLKTGLEGIPRAFGWIHARWESQVGTGWVVGGVGITEWVSGANGKVHVGRTGPGGGQDGGVYGAVGIIGAGRGVDAGGYQRSLGEGLAGRNKGQRKKSLCAGNSNALNVAIFV